MILQLHCSSAKDYSSTDSMAIITTIVEEYTNWAAPPSVGPDVRLEQTSGASYGRVIGGGLSNVTL